MATFSISARLGDWRDGFAATCSRKGLDVSPDAVEAFNMDELQVATSLLLLNLIRINNLQEVKSAQEPGNVGDISILGTNLLSPTFLDTLKPLVKVAAVESSSDRLIWDAIHAALAFFAEPRTPPRAPQHRSIPTLQQQTPFTFNMSSLMNSAEQRNLADGVVRAELGSLYVGIPDFEQAMFSGVADVGPISQTLFEQCRSAGPNDNSLRYVDGTGWQGWPSPTGERAVLDWLLATTHQIADLASSAGLSMPITRFPIAFPNQPIRGSAAERKLDIGFTAVHREQPAAYHWKDILVPGELKSEPNRDRLSTTWHDLGRHVREVFAAQPTRRFVPGFTMCGSLMRLWVFDRLGGTASQPFDINMDGPRFVRAILIFLCMDRRQLGFDPTITANGHSQEEQDSNADEYGRPRYLTITRQGRPERLVIDRLIVSRAACINGRATTCWLAYHEDDDGKRTPLVVKDSWQYSQRTEEGELLQQVAGHVTNVARYYHHETVMIDGEVDDINLIRRGLDVHAAADYQPPDDDDDSPAVHRKRKYGPEASASNKRARSWQDTASSMSEQPALVNRVHRRVIVRDFGKPLYTAKSPLVLVAALVECIKGHRSLYQQDLLHRDVSTGNMLIRDDDEIGADLIPWTAFLIDMDIAIKLDRTVPSGSKGRTGTKAFMSIKVLRGSNKNTSYAHTFMDDLESFFWVLFWICVHYTSPEADRRVPQFANWHTLPMKGVGDMKLGLVAMREMWVESLQEDVTPHYKPLIPLLTDLRDLMFPNNVPHTTEDEGLYERMLNLFGRHIERLGQALAVVEPSR